jgi:hypothetical protein
MTTAPSNLLAVRRLLLDTIKGLDSAAVGIVGDPAHRGGYHTGSDRVVANDYSVVESPRDSAGLTLYASGLDVGTFSVRSGGATHNLQTFSTWCVAQCRANTADSRDLREIIYSPDGKRVVRWDRLGRRSSGDDSHLWHTHFSFFRDSTKAGRDQTPLFRRYLTSIGLLKAPKPVEVPVAQDPVAWATTNRAAALLSGAPARYQIEGEKQPRSEPNRLFEALTGIGAQVAALRADLAALAGRDLVDEAQLAADLAPSLLAYLNPAAIAAAIPPTIAKQVADELAGRLGQARE